MNRVSRKKKNKKKTESSSSPDCSGILLRNEVQQKIKRKAGLNV